MKTNKLILIALGLTVALTGFSQKNKKEAPSQNISATAVATAEVKQAPKETPECTLNMSLFYESAKIKNYADALQPWEEVYRDCPNMNKLIYTYGARIINWQIENATDATQKEALVDKLMKLYDDQIKYFGNDARNPKAWILGMKAYYHLLYRPQDINTPYPWLQESVKTLGYNSELLFVQQLFVNSYNKYQADPTSNREAFINDYLLCADILATNANNTALKNQSQFADMRDNVNSSFATSGAADCTQMENIYASKIEENKTNLEFLNSTMLLFKRVACTENNAYFKAALYAHNIAPTEESANGCGEMAYKKEEFTKAINYFIEAAKLASDDKAAAAHYFKVAQVYNKINNSVKSREYARLSLEKNPNQGNPYILIGVLYAGSRGIFDDATLNKTVFWAAVDKFIKAKQVEPTAEIIEKADDLIRTYSKYYPTKEEVFFQPDLGEGKSFFVGGWIGESTICR